MGSSGSKQEESRDSPAKTGLQGPRGEKKILDLCETEEQMEKMRVLLLKKKINQLNQLSLLRCEIERIHRERGDSEKRGSRESRQEETSKERESTPEEKRYDPDDPTLTIVAEEDQLDFELDNFPSPRALMSCGHAVTPTSLTNWCRRQLDQGQRFFVCGMPDCDAQWSFEEVRQMALLTPEEIRYFENKISENTRDCFNTKSCPGCQSTVMRSDLNDLCTQCTVCTNDRKEPFFFCWQCLREWRGPSPRTDRCDNKDCFNKSLETLKNCPDMTFLKVKGVTGCPSIRACPSCGFLLGHDQTGCKNLVCPRCGEEFCFVCLKKKKICCETRGIYDLCSGGVAPRQTSIPALKWEDWYR
uniref:E3 ubiquitin-protein ligase RNF19A-like n=1 Tax=Salarias fasciatus TaxID=181472 RepID=A0A672F9X9_SALFA